jgi:hypothetical protein
VAASRARSEAMGPRGRQEAVQQTRGAESVRVQKSSEARCPPSPPPPPSSPSLARAEPMRRRAAAPSVRGSARSEPPTAPLTGPRSARSISHDERTHAVPTAIVALPSLAFAGACATPKGLD